jgi:hypothetical protein
MGQELDEPLQNRGYREYFWFSLTLMALLVCAAVKNPEHLGVAAASFATSQAPASR